MIKNRKMLCHRYCLSGLKEIIRKVTNGVRINGKVHALLVYADDVNLTKKRMLKKQNYCYEKVKSLNILEFTKLSARNRLYFTHRKDL